MRFSKVSVRADWSKQRGKGNKGELCDKFSIFFENYFLSARVDHLARGGDTHPEEERLRPPRPGGQRVSVCTHVGVNKIIMTRVTADLVTRRQISSDTGLISGS